MSLVNYNTGLAIFLDSVEHMGLRYHKGLATTYTESLVIEIEEQESGHGLTPWELYNLVEIAEALDDLGGDVIAEMGGDELSEHFDEFQTITKL